MGSNCWFGSRFDWTQRVFMGCIAWIMILWSTLQIHTVIFSARFYLIRRLNLVSRFSVEQSVWKSVRIAKYHALSSHHIWFSFYPKLYCTVYSKLVLLLIHLLIFCVEFGRSHQNTKLFQSLFLAILYSLSLSEKNVIEIFYYFIISPSLWMKVWGFLKRIIF